MDNYFVARDQTPLDEDGKPDFESVQAINQERLAEDLNLLARGDRVHLPKFDFITGTFSADRSMGESVTYSLDKSYVHVEYRIRDDGIYEHRKIDYSNATSEWKPIRTQKQPGTYKDWELIVAEKIADKVEK